MQRNFISLTSLGRHQQICNKIAYIWKKKQRICMAKIKYDRFFRCCHIVLYVDKTAFAFRPNGFMIQMERTRLTDSISLSQSLPLFQNKMHITIYMQQQSCFPCEHFIKFSSWISPAKIYPIKWHVEVKRQANRVTPHEWTTYKKIFEWQEEKKHRVDNVNWHSCLMLFSVSLLIHIPSIHVQ